VVDIPRSTVLSSDLVGFGVGTGTDYRFDDVSVSPAGTLEAPVFYQYDALGRRVAKTMNGETTYYTYAGARLIEERDDEGAVAATYVYGNYIDEVLQMRRGGEDYFYHTDDQFNVMAVTDSSGAVVERYDYGDFGYPQFYAPDGSARDATAIGNPWLFTGRQWDPELAAYYYRTRYFDPLAGRFLSPDAIGNWGDPLNLGNAYTYTGNNPWSWLDPWGELSYYPGFENDVEGARQLMSGTPAGRVATTGVVTGLNGLAWGLTGPIGGIPVTGVTVLLGGTTAYYNRQAQYLEATGESLSTGDATAIVAGDVTGASALYTAVSGQDPLVGTYVSTGERVESGAHLVVGLAGFHGGSKLGAVAKVGPSQCPTTVESTSKAKPSVDAAGSRGVSVHEQVAMEYVENGATYLGRFHPISDIAAGSEHISIRTVDLASKTYLYPKPGYNVHPLTSTLTGKAWKLVDIDSPGPKVLHVELYGPRPTAIQVQAVEAAIHEAARFDLTPVEIRVGYRP
jgi:RHS repeat-associated protein